MLIPSIDLMNGCAVQLVRGKEKKIEVTDVFGLAKEYSRYGKIAVIDLDAAMGIGNNTVLIKKLCRKYECIVGGGIRTVELAQEYLKCGAMKVIIGTKAEKNFLELLPKKRVIVALDYSDDLVMVNGWTKKTKYSVISRIKELENYCSGFLCTNINLEGTMKGVDWESIKKIRSATDKKITFAGGIQSVEEIKKFEKEEQISEDETKRTLDDIQKTTDTFVKRCDEIKSHKDAEVMEV